MNNDNNESVRSHPTLEELQAAVKSVAELRREGYQVQIQHHRVCVTPIVYSESQGSIPKMIYEYALIPFSRKAGGLPLGSFLSNSGGQTTVSIEKDNVITSFSTVCSPTDQFQYKFGVYYSLFEISKVIPEIARK